MACLPHCLRKTVLRDVVRAKAATTEVGIKSDMLGSGRRDLGMLVGFDVLATETKVEPDAVVLLDDAVLGLPAGL